MLTLLFDKQFWISLLICLALAGVVVLYALKPKSRPYIITALCGVLMITSVVSIVNLNRYYSAEGGIRGLLSSVINGENKGEVVDNTVSLNKVMLTLDEDGNYSATIIPQKSISLDAEKTYSVLVNGLPCSYVEDYPDYILAKYEYNFYDKNQDYKTDTLEIYFTMDKQTKVEVLTRGGSEMVKSWNYYFNRNDFVIKIVEVNENFSYKEPQDYVTESPLIFEYEANTKTAAVFKNSSNFPTGDLIIPSKVVYEGDVYTVTTIGDNAFSQCSEISSITIPSSITSISYAAFSGCTNLKSVIIPESVTKIGESAFNKCTSLKAITIPSGVTEIEKSTFIHCEQLSSVIIPSSITSIAQFAFYDTNLKSITIPSSVTQIGMYAFYKCPLNSVVFENTEDWQVNANNGTNIDSTELANPSVAATLLSSDNYGLSTWEKNSSGVSEEPTPPVTYSGWEKISWNIPVMYGENVWTDGVETYYSYEDDQYILNKETLTWEEKIWIGFSDRADPWKNIVGYRIWTDGFDVFYSRVTMDQCVLNKETSTWEEITWGDNFPTTGEGIWTDGVKTYYSYEDDQYILNKATSTWEVKTWNGFKPVNGKNVWTDGVEVYYSKGADQYILNKVTLTWEEKVWTDLTKFEGENVWTDGVETYYSNWSDQYILNKTTLTWEEKVWNGSSGFYGKEVWTDGTNYYYSSNTVHYKLVQGEI